MEYQKYEYDESIFESTFERMIFGQAIYLNYLCKRMYGWHEPKTKSKKFICKEDFDDLPSMALVYGPYIR